METIHVKFDELTAMASLECNNSGSRLNIARISISSEELNEIPSQQDLDNLFGPLYKEYYAPSTSKVSNNSVANTLDDDDTPSPSSFIVEDTSLTEPKNIKEAMLDHSWIKSMQDELNQFKGLDVYELVPLHEGRHAIKMDVKTAFLNGPLKEEVFVAWYDKLSSFLIEHHFTQGIVDPTLYTRRHRDGILLVQIYVDDISFGSTNPVFSNRFEKLMKDNFEMLMMGEMKFFLGLQIHQSPRGIFINQSQYTMELLRKTPKMEKCNYLLIYEMATAKSMQILQVLNDQTKYHSMIGGLMYLTASRPNIAFATFVCARYQARPTEKHLKEVKRIFRYLRQSINKGLWYSKDSVFDLITYSDADLAGCLDDYKSTSGGL
ncbi:retrovirus-related pol polyprotein from transposon TNT 1-94 [Tanacetum coccineum]